MKIKHKIRLRNLYILVCTIACILSMNPYFVWNTYAGGFMAYTVYLFYTLAIVSCVKMGAQVHRVKKYSFIGMVLLFLLYILTYVHSFEESSITSLIAGALMFVYLWMLTLCNQKTKADIFKCFVTVFAISLLPGLIYYFLEMVGISLSIGTLYSPNQLQYQNSVEYKILNLGDYYDYYKHYIGAVVRVNANTRFSGIYDEAGLVGTIAALVLCARGFKFKNNKTNIFLLVCLVFSFSLAGYILLIGFYALKWFREKQWKLFLGILMFAVLLIVFLNIETDNSTIQYLQSRIKLTSTGISFANNRLTSNYMTGFVTFQEGNIFVKLFGLGKGASAANPYMNGSSSYLDMIYNFGYIGFGLMVLAILYLYCCFHFVSLVKRWQEFVLLVLFVISMYQRPGIYVPFYFIVLFCGQAYIRTEGDKHASN